ncbi:unnamed protein product, partial [Mesorhabditis spiculigera]
MRSGVLRLLLATWACALVAAADPVGPITTHFEEWLKSNGYGEFDYARRDLGEVGSYGGKKDDHQEVQQTPIVFIHGNTDGALKEPGPYSSGSSAQIAYFESKGYTQAELYVTTWGNRRLDEAAYQAHNCSTLVRLRRFVEAVLKYTGKKAIHLSGHSMGVTLARKVAKGGKVTEKLNGNTCDLGPPLTEQIDVFWGSAARTTACAPASPRRILVMKLTASGLGTVAARTTAKCVASSLYPKNAISRTIPACFIR